MKKVDINVDLAEGFPFDDELLKIATSANVCCGAHAGSVDLTLATVEKCRSQGVRVGAHPGVPDRENMGRRPLSLDDAEETRVLTLEILSQLEISEWSYVKPHGALYNATAVNNPHAKFLLTAVVTQANVPLLGLPNTEHQRFAELCNVAFIREGFADRLYLENGLLAPRSMEGSILHDPKQIAEQVKRLAEQVDSICIHGDSPGSVEIAELVRKTLEDSGYEVGH